MSALGGSKAGRCIRYLGYGLSLSVLGFNVRKGRVRLMKATINADFANCRSMRIADTLSSAAKALPEG